MAKRLKDMKRGDDVGVFAHDLPDRPNSDRPAPLHISDSEDPDEFDEEEDEESEKEIPDDGWSVKKKAGKWFLCQTDTAFDDVELGPPVNSKSGYYEVYAGRRGVQMLWQGKAAKEDFPPTACHDFYNEVKFAEKELAAMERSKKRSQVTPNLKGMGGQWVCYVCFKVHKNWEVDDLTKLYSNFH